MTLSIRVCLPPTFPFFSSCQPSSSIISSIPWFSRIPHSFVSNEREPKDDAPRHLVTVLAILPSPLSFPRGRIARSKIGMERGLLIAYVLQFKFPVAAQMTMPLIPRRVGIKETLDSCKIINKASLLIKGRKYWGQYYTVTTPTTPLYYMSPSRMLVS